MLSLQKDPHWASGATTEEDAVAAGRAYCDSPDIAREILTAKHGQDHAEVFFDAADLWLCQDVITFPTP